MLALVLVASAADRALYYVGHGGLDPRGHTAFDAALLATGVTAVDEASTWPADLAPYHLLVIAAPSTTLSTSEVADLQAMHDRGDVVVIEADVDRSDVAVVEAVRTSLGLSSAFHYDVFDTACGHPATVATAHELTAGIHSVEYGASVEILTAGAGVPLLTGESGQTLLVEEDGWVLAADINMFDDGCTTWTLDNATMVTNLWNSRCVGQDNDGDGYRPVVCGDLDCDDADASISPEAAELCDGLDQDCDGEVDDAAIDAGLWYRDSDGDGFGDPGTEVSGCERPEGHVDNLYDCDDADPAIRPFADERCDGVDEDCDGVVDEDPIDGILCYADADGDGYGDAATPTVVCVESKAWVADGTDCDDTTARRSPGGVETCDELDNDCDDIVDDGLSLPTWYADGDGDGVGDEGTSVTACAAPDGFVGAAGDCDDADATRAAECDPKADPGNADAAGCGCAASRPSPVWAAVLLVLRRRRGRR